MPRNIRRGVSGVGSADAVVFGPNQARKAIIISGLPVGAFLSVSFGQSTADGAHLTVNTAGSPTVLTAELLGEALLGEIHATSSGGTAVTISEIYGD